MEAHDKSFEFQRWWHEKYGHSLPDDSSGGGRRFVAENQSMVKAKEDHGLYIGLRRAKS